ncbi:hypothetical protein D9619_010283 [Psilocybe cf. subviscida]|uniref:DUF6533 domain-containing protein n=1 Tax=Psilocybe cf. subviscida TaxID=2480587 RepID=A0A8H5ASF6_9AGAR|nr:hypothetical protein D9619_010283 [Psilocybe cf. subviscida]
MEDIMVPPIEGLLADRNGAYIYLAFCVAALYDHLTSLDLEVDFIWRRPKLTSVAQLAFIVNRYLGDAVLIYIATVLILQARPEAVGHPHSKDLQCASLRQVSVWGAAVVTWTMQAIMVTRINVMYRDSFVIKLVQYAFFAVEVVTMIIMTVFLPGNSEPSRSPDWYKWQWGPIISFEVLMLSLSIWAGYLHYRDYSLTTGGKSIRPVFTDQGKTLAYVMMRDSILYPFIAMMLVVFNFAVWNTLPFTAAQVNTAIMVLAPRILGSRLILNLREVYYRPFGDEYSRDFTNTFRTPVHFAQGTTQISTKGSYGVGIYLQTRPIHMPPDYLC